MAPQAHPAHGQPPTPRFYIRGLEKDTKQASLFVVGVPFIVVTSVVVVLRVHVRVRLLRLRLAVDDYMMVAGTLCTIGLSIATMFSGYYGVGMHTPSIPAQNLTPMLRANLACRLLYTTAVFLVKSSILLFYLRLDPRLRTRRLVYVLLVWVALLSIVTFLVLLFVCMPPSLFWEWRAQARAPEKCLGQSTQQVFFEVNGGMNIVQDIAIYILPLSILWKLQMPRSQKAALGAILCVGLVAVVAGCVRFYCVLSLGNEADIWWYMADSLNWCSIEIYAAIICSSASTLKILVKTYIPKVWNGTAHSSCSRSRSYSNGRGACTQSTTTSTRHKRSGSKEYSTKPCTATSERELSDRKYGFVTEMGNESEEAIAGVGDVGDEKENGSREEGVRDGPGRTDEEGTRAVGEEGRGAMMSETPRVEDDQC